MKEYEIARLARRIVSSDFALGVRIYPVASSQEAACVLEEIKQQFGIIFITETVAQEMMEVNNMSQEALPAIVLIP